MASNVTIALPLSFPFSSYKLVMLLSVERWDSFGRFISSSDYLGACISCALLLLFPSVYSTRYCCLWTSLGNAQENQCAPSTDACRRLWLTTAGETIGSKHTCLPHSNAVARDHVQMTLVLSAVWLILPVVCLSVCV